MSMCNKKILHEMKFHNHGSLSPLLIANFLFSTHFTGQIRTNLDQDTGKKYFSSCATLFPCLQTKKVKYRVGKMPAFKKNLSEN